MADWNRYLGADITPEQYKAQGGTEKSLCRDLQELWGNPKQGDDYMSLKEVHRVAKELAQQYL